MRGGDDQPAPCEMIPHQPRKQALPRGIQRLAGGDLESEAGKPLPAASHTPEIAPREPHLAPSQPSRNLWLPHQNFWLPQCCSTIVGVAVPMERFYKPELDAADNPPLQVIRPSLTDGALDGVMIPLPGITIKIGISSHDLARQLQKPEDPQGRRQDLRLLQTAYRREKRSEGNFQAALFDEGALGKPAAQ